MGIDENLRYSLQLEVYNKLLTVKQNEVLTDYLNNNLSLAEIGEKYNFSRQAAYEFVAKTRKKLDEYENNLHLYQKLTDIKKVIDEIKSDTNDKIILQKLNIIKKIINE